MRTGRPNTPGERKDRPEGEGRVMTASDVNPSAAAETQVLYSTALLQDGRYTYTNREA